MKIGEGNVGTLKGLVDVPYVPWESTVLDHLNTAYYHVHGQSFVYPNHADDVVLTSDGDAWGVTGSKIEVVPVNTLDVANFDLHWINISNIDGTTQIQIDIYAGLAGSEVLIGSTRAARTTNQSRNGPARIQIPQQVVNERISCLLSSQESSVTTCSVSFEGHYYA